MWFQQPDAFTLVQFCVECGPDHLLKWFERSDLNASRKLFEGHPFQDRIAIQSENTHEVTRCKQPQKVQSRGSSRTGLGSTDLNDSFPTKNLQFYLRIFH